MFNLAHTKCSMQQYGQPLLIPSRVHFSNKHSSTAGISVIAHANHDVLGGATIQTGRAKFKNCLVGCHLPFAET